jgi:hypothetical protein
MIQCKPETSCKMEWRTESSQMLRKLHLQKPRTKTVLFIFYDNQVVIYKEFISEGKTMKIQALERLLKKI